RAGGRDRPRLGRGVGPRRLRLVRPLQGGAAPAVRAAPAAPRAGTAGRRGAGGGALPAPGDGPVHGGGPPPERVPAGPGAAAAVGGDYELRLLALLRGRRVGANETLANHIHRHFEEWFLFLTDARVPPSNWEAEQAIRPAVVNRKVWGGNRTEAGARAQGVLS